jgi:hypothetical protein
MGRKNKTPLLHVKRLPEKIAYVNDIGRCGYDYAVERARERREEQIRVILGEVKGRRG